MAVVGIDLGTTNSVVATLRSGQVVVVPDEKGRRLHPSVVWLGPEGRHLFSHEALEQRTRDPAFAIYSAKRLIGHPFKSDEVSLTAARVPYQIVEGPNEQAVIAGPDRTYTIPEISAELLGYLKRCAERQLGEPVTQAVVTVPANFDDGQRRATMDAGRIAGLEIVRVLNEPTAAAVAYGMGRNMSQRIAVYDLGGGTFDVTVLQVEGEVFEVLATGGDSFLGGDDVDSAILNLLSDRWKKERGTDPRGDAPTRARLMMAAEQIKRHLSVHEEARGELKNIANAPDGTPMDLSFLVTRADFEGAISGLVARTLTTCEEVLGRAGLTKSQVDEVILVGGTTRIPLIRREVERAFGRPPRTDIDPDEVVAWGAAIQANTLVQGSSGSPVARPVLLDVTPRALGIAVAGGYCESIIERNVPVPIEQTRAFTTSADNQTQVRIQVCQGESRRFDDNVPMGELELQGLAPAKRGAVKIEVTFRVDTNGILRVRALDPESGLKQEATVNVRGGMSEDEVVAAQKRRGKTGDESASVPATPAS